MPVIDCLHLQPSEAYIETMKSTNRTAPQTTWTGSFITDPVSLLNSTTGSDGSSSGSGASGVSTTVSTSDGVAVTVTVGPGASGTVSVRLNFFYFPILLGVVGIELFTDVGVCFCF